MTMSKFMLMCFQLILLLTLFLNKTVCVISTTNYVLGTPSVDCDTRQIDLRLNTKEPFRGKVYIKGNAHRKECVNDFSSNTPDNQTELRTIIDYNSCNTERIRSLEPLGVTYANTIIVQFHQTFVTKGDKSYHIRCFYMESEKTLASNFEVSMIPTGAVFHDMELPSCAYTVRSQTPNGPLIRSARVGDQVFHRWECRGNNAFYGMAVHSCFVENVDGRQTPILDTNGCTLDGKLLPELVYSNDLGLAYSEAQVFKYPDYAYIHFRCQIRLCTKMDGSCKGLTPPICDNRRRARSLGSYSDTLSPNDPSLDVVSKDILVVDETEALNSAFLGPGTPTSRSPSYKFSPSPSSKFSSRTASTLNIHQSHWQLCVNRMILISILLGFILFFVGALSFVGYVMAQQTNKEGVQRHRESNVTTNKP